MMSKPSKTSISKSVADFSCPVCNSKQLKTFLEINDVPIFCNLLWTSHEEALNCQKGDIKLAFCLNCSHIMNVAFDPNLLDYTQVYENPLDYSPRFQAYSQNLAKKLIERYGLEDKDIISIGCGKGIFLSTLCEFGNNRGVGFDPALQRISEPLEISDRIELIKDYYSEQYSDYTCDLFVCRHVLEHVFDPKAFLMMLRRAIGSRQNTSVFFEVPNALNIFQNFFIWDIIYEHFSYFTPISLSHLFLLSNFQVHDVDEYFEGQFLGIHASPGKQVVLDNSEQKNDINKIAKNIELFGHTYTKVVNEWKRKLQQKKNEGQRVVIWGAGSKGVSFLNALKSFDIEYAVDINPNKHGKYVAGTGQQIVFPRFLQKYQPDLIIVMNPIYKQEIKEFIARLGISSSIETF